MIAVPSRELTRSPSEPPSPHANLRTSPEELSRFALSCWQRRDAHGELIAVPSRELRQRKW
ncbi:hypothetical protein TRAPUB_2559 [Trametes pubescens]|uniref:Uncharacterized protein n=1 Tax=Trametes pubescens TaxID=154538 RepID=A0A1M2VG86_TRAPU|nr:hypothetical protein TRAPUB_2559 [Trametes pubescens]